MEEDAESSSDADSDELYGDINGWERMCFKNFILRYMNLKCVQSRHQKNEKIFDYLDEYELIKISGLLS